jgi:membrane fusion protein (multidrug efflux system)
MHFPNLVKLLFLSIAIGGLSIFALNSPAVETATDGTAVKTVLFPFREAILSSMVEAAVRSHKFKEGERFNAGDRLIDLNDDTFKERLIKAKSACIESKAGVAFAEKNLSRTKDLHKRGLQGLQDVERCELEVDIANSKQMFQDANLKLAEQDLASCHIAAPFAGRLVKKLLQEHEFVKVGQSLIQIIDDNQLLAVMHLPSSERNLVKIGESQRVQVDETASAHTGTVYEIGGEIDYGSRTFEIKLLIDNRDGALSAGMSGHLLTTKVGVAGN